MNFKFLKSNFYDLENKISSYFTNNDILIDSYLEEIVLRSNFYKIMIDNTYIGFCAIEKKHTLVLFNLELEFAHLGEDVFFKARKLEFISNALISTSDEYFMAHAMDSFGSFEKEGYFTRLRTADLKISSNTILSLATMEDFEMINELSEKFYQESLSRMLEEKTFYLAKNKLGELVGFGHAEPGKINKDKISVGMFVIASHRSNGHGSDILRGLRDLVIALEKTPIAGCWAFNHNSLKAQINAGFYPATRMVKFK